MRIFQTSNTYNSLTITTPIIRIVQQDINSIVFQTTNTIFNSSVYLEENIQLNSENNPTLLISEN
jgi:hypothetical protein